MNLWLDDVRDPLLMGYVGWTWVKTCKDAIAMLSTGRVVRASLDHDLSIPAAIGIPDGERTGYHVVCWMEENNVWPPKGTHVHSMNPAGAARMRQVIEKGYAQLPPEEK